MTISTALSARQLEQAQSYCEIVGSYGKWSQSYFAEGAHYFDSEDNPFIEDGITCDNCIFYLPEGRCQLVRGQINPEGLCKLWIIPDNYLRE